MMPYPVPARQVLKRAAVAAAAAAQPSSRHSGRRHQQSSLGAPGVQCVPWGRSLGGTEMGVCHTSGAEVSPSATSRSDLRARLELAEHQGRHLEGIAQQNENARNHQLITHASEFVENNSNKSRG